MSELPENLFYTICSLCHYIILQYDVFYLVPEHLHNYDAALCIDCARTLQLRDWEI